MKAFTLVATAAAGLEAGWTWARELGYDTQVEMVVRFQDWCSCNYGTNLWFGGGRSYQRL